MKFLVMFALSEDYNDFILNEVNVLLEMQGFVPHETYDMCVTLRLRIAAGMSTSFRFAALLPPQV
jgi:hypothetical protein